MDKFSCH